jgi:hypothetical protein
MPPDASGPDTRSRRSVLAAAVGGAAALAATSLARPLRVDAASTALMTEVDNPTTAKTSISAVSSLTIDGDIAFETTVGDLATAIHGDSPNGIAIYGTSANAHGVIGDATAGTGVMGRAGDPNTYGTASGFGVHGFSSVEGSSGVFGEGEVGVYAAGFIGSFSVGSPGVVGLGDGLGPPGQYGTGVYGYSGGTNPPQPPNNVGVYARGDGTAVALKVQGKAQFSRSGKSYVSASRSTRVITLAGVTTASLIIVTLQTYRAGVYVLAAVPAAGKFTVYLNKVVPGTTYFAYFIVN